MPILWLVEYVCTLILYFVLRPSFYRTLGANEDFALKLPPKGKPF